MVTTPFVPPRFAEALLRWMLRQESWCETTLGDLREEFVSVGDARGRRRAHLWYWREFFTLIKDRQLSAWRHRLARTAVRRDSSMRTLFTEVRLAARALWRQPLVSIVVVVVSLILILMVLLREAFLGNIVLMRAVILHLYLRLSILVCVRSCRRFLRCVVPYLHPFLDCVSQRVCTTKYCLWVSKHLHPNFLSIFECT